MIHFLSQNISSKQATAIGLLAVALWSFVISLIRSLSLHMGGSGRRGNDVHPVYRIDLADFRPAAFAQLQPQLFVLGKRVFCWLRTVFVAIGRFAQNARQAVEIGMVNYLWPTFYHRRSGIFQQNSRQNGG